MSNFRKVFEEDPTIIKGDTTKKTITVKSPTPKIARERTKQILNQYPEFRPTTMFYQSNIIDEPVIYFIKNIDEFLLHGTFSNKLNELNKLNDKSIPVEFDHVFVFSHSTGNILFVWDDNPDGDRILRLPAIQVISDSTRYQNLISKMYNLSIRNINNITTKLSTFEIDGVVHNHYFLGYKYEENPIIDGLSYAWLSWDDICRHSVPVTENIERLMKEDKIINEDIKPYMDEKKKAGNKIQEILNSMKKGE